MTERTTKYVTLTIKARFYGDYLAKDEVRARLEQWIDGGLCDRDDLHGWDFGPATVEEIEGDPEGYDS